jgi:head-tail adaptor
MGEFSGRLSERVRFEGRSNLRGLAGDRVSGWTLLFERWASVEPVRRSDPTIVRGDTLQSVRRWQVVVRDGVQPTLDMRLRWRGLTLRPTGIEIDPASAGRILILAEDDGRGGDDAEQP